MTISANAWLVFVLGFLLISTAFELLKEFLNLTTLQTALPAEMQTTYDESTYEKSQRYLKTLTQFGMVQRVLSFSVTALFIYFGGFGLVDRIARSLAGNLGEKEWINALFFAAILGFSVRILSVPFSVYHTFVIEERFGFNRTSVKTFWTDFFKGIVLGGVLGGIAYLGVVWFFERDPQNGWWLAWLGLTLFQLFVMFVAPVWIMPLFNKYIPLEEGELKEKIKQFADRENFSLNGIFKMDGSKRSTKANAFFTGFGKYRRIVLFDTLIKNHTTDELVAVLAHEIGHYKLKHILKSIFVSIFISGIALFGMQFLLNHPTLFEAFQMEHISVYASLIFVGLIYGPFSKVLGFWGNWVSRKNEFEADRYSIEKFPLPDAMISALKKLSRDNLSNLTPHPLKVFADYSHPPVLERVNAIRTLGRSV